MRTGGDQLDPDQLESAEFPVVRRGFEPELVRTQLVIVADEIRRLRTIVAELEGELSTLQARAPADLEAERITEAIGDEAVRLLEAARLAAGERAERAESEAAEMIAGAERASAELRAEAGADRDQLGLEAQRAADELVEQSRDRGRDMVAEAQTVRERMLRDLARKRQTHRAEVEQLRAGRDRLLESLAAAQQSLDETMADLVSAVPEAQAAAERAGLRVNGEPEVTVDQLEAEIATARMIDHPMVDGVREPGMIEETEQPAELEETEEPGKPEETEELDETEETEETGDPEVAPYDIESEDVGDLSGSEPVGVDNLFARLRSSRENVEPAPEPVEVVVPDPGPVEVVEPASEPDDLDGADAAACSDAVDEIARSLKRLVVAEQGDLLDGLRRGGADGVRDVLDDGAAYSGVLVEPLQALVSAVVGENAEVETGAAESSVQTLLVEPVRSRLRSALDDTDDPDELRTTVRAVYRECRSRRVGEAASAAVSVVYEIAVGARGSTHA